MTATVAAGGSYIQTGVSSSSGMPSTTAGTTTANTAMAMQRTATDLWCRKGMSNRPA